ncbi:FAD-dependent oxidoreductase [Desulfofalx alkaliphila]|uniref:FAD-dependent oxidoreductase n=1 Tax=Desulfofalx alkaliphila TaxID=105483 RepID=UPI0004E1D559|nr:FAD-dependent oxidoreductase [Desulfofalx alkaliphila]
MTLLFNRSVNILLVLVLAAAMLFAGAPGAAAGEWENQYDLIVVGSDPEGIAAAVSGARNGLDTLLVDTRSQVGGLMTQGWLNTIDMCYAPNRYGPKSKNQVLNEGIFLEFFRQVEGDSFDVRTAQRVFDQMLAQEENLEVLLNVKEIKPVVSRWNRKDYVDGVEVVTAGGKRVTYYGDRIIDATQDADLAAAAGVPYSYGQADSGYPDRNMAVTQVFKLGGVTDEDWRLLMRTLIHDGDKNTGANDVSAWGFLEIMEAYKPQNPDIRMRGLNIGRQNDGTVLINAMQIFNVNPLDAKSRQHAKTIAQQELQHVVPYINEHIPGLANARLMGLAPELYVRESRHIYGEYRLTIDDVLENRDFPDRIAFGSYPVDVQATGWEDIGYVVGRPHQFAVPFRSIVPQKVENLLVVGRSASFDSLPHGSARVIPVGMATGQAAGAAAALSIEKDISFREMCRDERAISELQQRLTNQGMKLNPIEPTRSWNAVTEHWAYEGLKFVRKHGLAIGSYDNDYRLDEPITAEAFMSKLERLADIYDIKSPQGLEIDLDHGDELNVEDVEDIFSQYGDGLTERHWSSKMRRNAEENDGVITRGNAFELLNFFVNKMQRR